MPTLTLSTHLQYLLLVLLTSLILKASCGKRCKWQVFPVKYPCFSVCQWLPLKFVLLALKSETHVNVSVTAVMKKVMTAVQRIALHFSLKWPELFSTWMLCLWRAKKENLRNYRIRLLRWCLLWFLNIYTGPFIQAFKYPLTTVQRSALHFFQL